MGIWNKIFGKKTKKEIPRGLTLIDTVKEKNNTSLAKKQNLNKKYNPNVARGKDGRFIAKGISAHENK